MFNGIFMDISLTRHRPSLRCEETRQSPGKTKDHPQTFPRATGKEASMYTGESSRFGESTVLRQDPNQLTACD